MAVVPTATAVVLCGRSGACVSLSQHCLWRVSCRRRHPTVRGPHWCRPRGDVPCGASRQAAAALRDGWEGPTRTTVGNTRDMVDRPDVPAAERATRSARRAGRCPAHSGASGVGHSQESPAATRTRRYDRSSQHRPRQEDRVWTEAQALGAPSLRIRQGSSKRLPPERTKRPMIAMAGPAW